jgi:2-polyprenyl-6-hydroxyphenyl methylase/3-demethylubiquinone-9 3-methyltransferase
MVARVRDLLAPSGHFFLSTPYQSYLKILALALTGKLDSHFTALWDHGISSFGL